jgi:hypothetical protein
LGGIVADKYEKFIQWYLRFNGYFTIDNFIVHAGDDPKRITYKGLVENYTETDVLGVRMPYSQEVSGTLRIANHEVLVNGAEDKFDFVIAEAKSGDDNKPNGVWKQSKELYPIEYIIRFAGLYASNNDIARIASELLSKYCYQDEKCRIRYIMFSNEVNKYWQSKGITYITFGEVVQFLVDVRGQSWIYSGIGVASRHDQWDPMVKDIFVIASDSGLTPNEKLSKVTDLLEQA